MWRSLANLDAYRRRFESTPDTLTNPILLGSLLVPLGISLQPDRHPATSDEEPTERRRAAGPRLGELPLARGDIERLRQILGLQRRLRDLGANPRAKRALVHRSIFRETLTWLEIHGGAPELVDDWKALQVESAASEPTAGALEGEPPPFSRRRRRRRRRFRPAPEH
jgi:hypothetical protein